MIISDDFDKKYTHMLYWIYVVYTQYSIILYDEKKSEREIE